LLAVQETRWLGGGILEKDCRIYYSCDDENIFGAGFIVSRHNVSRIIIFKPIGMRLWVPRIRGEFKSHSFFSAHVPPVCCHHLLYIFLITTKNIRSNVGYS